MVCKYCNNKFKTKSIIGHHQKTSKYCLKIQKDLGLKVTPLYILSKKSIPENRPRKTSYIV